MSHDLYHQDFFLWTRDQAEALRSRGANSLDYDRLAEEVEDLGSAERNRVRSAVRLIIEHLYKLHWTRNDQPIGHWLGEIANFRADMADNLTPSIKRLVEMDLEELHTKAGRAAALKFRTSEPTAVPDLSWRWSWTEITGETEDDPLDREYPIARV